MEVCPGRLWMPSLEALKARLDGAVPAYSRGWNYMVLKVPTQTILCLCVSVFEVSNEAQANKLYIYIFSFCS